MAVVFVCGVVSGYLTAIPNGPPPNWQREVDSLTTILHDQRTLAAMSRTKADTEAVRTRRSVARVDSTARATLTLADTAREVLRDSTANVAQLRASLEAVTASASHLADQVLTYEARLDTLLTTHLAERQAVANQMATMQAVMDRQAGALVAGRCSTFFGRCPTRWQAFGLGVVVAIAVVALW